MSAREIKAAIEAVARCYEEAAIDRPGLPGLRGNALHREVRAMVAEHNLPSYQIDAGERRARRRLAKRGIVIALLATLAPAALHAAPAPGVPKPPRAHVRPISSITVKVVSDEDFSRRAQETKADPAVTRGSRPPLWLVTSLDIDSCTAWVPMRQAAREVEAFRACREALDRTVDAAHAAAEKESAQ